MPRRTTAPTAPTPPEDTVTEVEVPEEAPAVEAPKRGRKADPATAVLRDLRKAQKELERVQNLISGQDELLAKRDELQADVDRLKGDLADVLK